MNIFNFFPRFSLLSFRTEFVEKLEKNYNYNTDFRSYRVVGQGSPRPKTIFQGVTPKGSSYQYNRTNLRQIKFFQWALVFFEILYQLPVFYPQGDPLGVYLKTNNVVYLGVYLKTNNMVYLNYFSTPRPILDLKVPLDRGPTILSQG